MSQAYACEILTKNGDFGVQVIRRERNGVVSFAYMGKWGAGSGHDVTTMQALIGQWIKSKRGITVTVPFNAN